MERFAGYKAFTKAFMGNSKEVKILSFQTELSGFTKIPEKQRVCNNKFMRIHDAVYMVLNGSLISVLEKLLIRPRGRRVKIMSYI